MTRDSRAETVSYCSTPFEQEQSHLEILKGPHKVIADVRGMVFVI
jgi:hypothetical protein